MVVVMDLAPPALDICYTNYISTLFSSSKHPKMHIKRWVVSLLISVV